MVRFGSNLMSLRSVTDRNPRRERDSQQHMQARQVHARGQAHAHDHDHALAHSIAPTKYARWGSTSTPGGGGGGRVAGEWWGWGGTASDELARAAMAKGRAMRSAGRRPSMAVTAAAMSGGVWPTISS